MTPKYFELGTRFLKTLAPVYYSFGQNLQFCNGKIPSIHYQRLKTFFIIQKVDQSLTFSGVDYCLKYFSLSSRKLISAGNSSLYVLKKLISPRNSFWVNLLLRHMCVFMFQKVESKHKVFQAGSYSALEQTRKLAQIIFSGMAR